MFNENRTAQFKAYNKARDSFIAHPNALIDLERLITDEVVSVCTANKSEIQRDYNEATRLFPFWQNYPPQERGRKPQGDQFPWIEVGEHTIGRKLSRYLERAFQIREPGFPTGPDERFVVSSEEIEKVTGGITSSAWVFVDVKSVGPRDDAPHAVMSHNQISGDGIWSDEKAGVQNGILVAQGARTSHDFHCAIPPLFVLSDGVIAPVVHLVLKPVYRMLCLEPECLDGQPLGRLEVICVPNGLLLTQNPNYLGTYPRLFFPGKDDKDKDPKKVRARVSFEILTAIDPWRVQRIDMP